MPDQSVLWIYQNIYEPTQKDGKWAVYYRNTTTNQWEEKKFDEHEPAFDFYYKKTKELQVYYNTFLYELGMKK